MSFDEIEKIDDIDRIFIKTKKSESHYLEYKEKIVKADSVTKPIVAFANADGGLIIIGIEEDDNHLPKEIKPVPLLDNQHTIENYILDTIQPKFTNFRIKSILGEEKDSGVLLVEVNKGLNTPYMASNHVHYVRREKKSESMTELEIREAIFRKGLKDALYVELKSNLGYSKNITKQNQALHESTRDKNEGPPDPNKLHIRTAIIPFRTEAWRAIVSSGLFSIIQEKYETLIELYNLISEFNFLAEYLKFDIRRVQTQEENHHEHLINKLQAKNTHIFTKLSESLKIFEKK